MIAAVEMIAADLVVLALLVRCSRVTGHVRVVTRVSANFRSNLQVINPSTVVNVSALSVVNNF
jgi:hypothetical protein